MDDTSIHGVDDSQDMDNEFENTGTDEGDDTPANTDHESDDSKSPAELAKEKQKSKWLDDIRSGKRTLDDMPSNLGWLRKEIEPELKQGTKSNAANEDTELDRRVQEALKRERSNEDLNLLVDDLEENASPEQLAQFKEEYDQLRADGASPLRATITARRLVGLHDSKTVIAERRKRGMMLPPNGSRRRDTVEKNKMTEIEKRLSGNLPPGFKA